MNAGYAKLSAREYLIQSTVRLIKKECQHFLDSSMSDKITLFHIETIQSYLDDLQEIYDIKY